MQAGFGHVITDAVITWTDITQFADTQAGVRNSRGAADERSEIQPGTCSMLLDNADGRFTPTLASSPYFPNVVKNVPVRVLVATTAKNLVTNPSFETNTDGWSATGSPAPTLARSTVRAQHGTASALVTWGAGGTPAVETTLFGLEFGVTYIASAQVYVPTGSPAVRLGIVGGATGTASATNDAFVQITVTFTATSAVHTLQLTPSTAPASGDQVWVDTVQAEQGATVTAFDSNGAQVHERFFGMVNEWPITWAGLHATVSITCTDTFKWLSRLPELQPMLVEEVLKTQRDHAAGSVAYYPMSEPSDSTTAGDLSGAVREALSIQQVGAGGTLTFAGSDGPPATGQQAPTFTPASASAGKYLSANLGTAFRLNGGFAECWFTTTTQGRVLFALEADTTEALQIETIVFSLESGTGKLRVDSRIATTGFSTSVAATGDLADGKPHWMLYDQNADDIYIDNLGPFSVTSQFVVDLPVLSVGGYEDPFGTFAGPALWNGTISHLALTDTTSGVPAAKFTPHFDAGGDGFAGEAANVRAGRLAGYAGLTATAQGTTFSSIASQGALGSSPLTHLREVETTESARLFADRASNTIVFQSRDVRFNPVSVVSLAYADLDTDNVEISDDDQKMINTVVASRPDGATVRVRDQAARDTFGPYEPSPLTLLKTTDNEVVDTAQWIVQRRAEPPPEMRQLPVEAFTLPLATYRALLDADVSTALNVTGLPDEAPAGTATVTVEGYTETIQHRQHHLDFHVSRTDTDSVWVLDNATYSSLGNTTRLGF